MSHIEENGVSCFMPELFAVGEECPWERMLILPTQQWLVDVCRLYPSWVALGFIGRLWEPEKTPEWQALTLEDKCEFAFNYQGALCQYVKENLSQNQISRLVGRARECAIANPRMSRQTRFEIRDELASIQWLLEMVYKDPVLVGTPLGEVRKLCRLADERAPKSFRAPDSEWASAVRCNDSWFAWWAK